MAELTGRDPPTKKLPWTLKFRAFFYRKDGEKMTANHLAVVALVGAIILLVFFLSSVNAVDESPSGESRSLDQRMEPIPLAEVPEYEEVKTKPPVLQNRESKPKPLARMAVINRSNTLEIPPGSMFKAKLLSGATNGPLRAEVSEPLLVAGEERIPAGVVLVGKGQSTEERLMVRFNHLVFKDGSFSSFQGQACDWGDQMVGLKGSKVGYYAQRVAAAAALNFIAGAAEGLQQETVQRGVAIKKPTPRNAALQGTKRAALEQGSETMSGLKSKSPVIEVPANTPIWVLVSGE